MSALLAVELRRILARRLVRVLAALELVGIVIAGVSVYFTSDEASRFELVNLTEIFKGTSVGLGMTAWVIGSSLMGADWQTETMRTTLTWEPRRGHLLFAKGLACMAVAALGALVLLTLLGAALLPAAAFQGTTAGADSAWFSSLIWTSLRISALVALAGLASIAIATIGRRASGALAVGFVYLAIIEGVIRGSVTSLQRWLIGDNAAVLVEGHSFDSLGGRSPLEAGFYLSLCAAALLLVALAWFRFRDVQ
jgi:hypothetical protein